jgi:cell division protein ZapA (FtsZ GTPase activity inhibitor)
MVMGFCQAYAQQSETIESVQSGVAKDIQYVQKKGGDLQDKVFTRIDSLSNKSANLIQTTTDSLNNLSSIIEGKITSKIDSLQQKLEQITKNRNEKLSNVTE